jgi:hypothetical protein
MTSEFSQDSQSQSISRLSGGAEGYQIRHREWGVFQGEFLGLGFWRPMSDEPEQGFCRFETLEQAQSYIDFLCSDRCAAPRQKSEFTIETFDAELSRQLEQSRSLANTQPLDAAFRQTLNESFLMNEQEQIEWKEGDIASTPFEPSGLVKILEIEPAGEIYGVTARVEFIEDHPHGYPKGSEGRYQLKELRKPIREPERHIEIPSYPRYG